jgi:hypothetical protein
MTETTDGASDERTTLEQRRRLVDLLFEQGALELEDRVLMARAWRCGPDERKRNPIPGKPRES